MRQTTVLRFRQPFRPHLEGDKAWLASQPAGRFEFIFMPKHDSWLYLVEGFFSKLGPLGAAPPSASHPSSSTGSWPPWMHSIAMPSFTHGPTNSTRPHDPIRIWKSMNSRRPNQRAVGSCHRDRPPSNVCALHKSAAFGQRTPISHESAARPIV